MGMKSKQYSDTVTLTLSEVKKVTKAQTAMLKNGLVKLDENKLTSAIGIGATLLGLIFVTKTVAGIIAGITGLLSGLGTSAQDALEDMVRTGSDYLEELEDWMEDNDEYDKVKVELPFIEYLVDGKEIRFVSGYGVVKKAHTGSGWIAID